MLVWFKDKHLKKMLSQGCVHLSVISVIFQWNVCFGMQFLGCQWLATPWWPGQPPGPTPRSMAVPAVASCSWCFRRRSLRKWWKSEKQHPPILRLYQTNILSVSTQDYVYQYFQCPTSKKNGKISTKLPPRHRTSSCNVRPQVRWPQYEALASILWDFYPWPNSRKKNMWGICLGYLYIMCPR